MPATAFTGALCTGHACFPPRPSGPGDSSFTINGIPVITATTPYLVHCCGPTCHVGEVAAGSATFLVNGLPAARIGDPVSCGSAIAQGDPTFLIGD